MKICYVNPAILLRRPVAELINDLSKDKNNEIGLLVPKKIFHKPDNSLHYSKMPPNVQVYTYSVIPFPGNFEWPIPTPWIFVQLFRIFKKYNIIHMWAHFYLANLYAAKIKLFFPKKKLILTIDAFPGYSFSSGKLIDSLFKIYTKTLGWFIYGIPNKITLYGKSLVPYAKKSGINPKKIEILPTGIELNKFGKAEKTIRKEFNIPEDKKIILYVGLLNSRKGIDTILRTAAKIKEDFVLIIVGDGPKRKEYQWLALDLNLDKKTIFTGFRKDIGSFYNSSDILFFPSRGEGLAGVIMEAMLSHLVVVSTDIPCTSDLVKNNENGFLCKIDDIDCFKKSLSFLLKNPDKAKSMGEDGFTKIQEFSWEKRLPGYKKLYSSLK